MRLFHCPLSLIVFQTDEQIARNLVQDKHGLSTHGGPLRRKGIDPQIDRVASSVGRAFFDSFSRGKIIRRGSRVIRHYSRRGRYQDAARDFDRLKLDNVKPLQAGDGTGRTGTIGNHRVTVRDGSSGSGSRPTLEIISHGGSLVRKFHYTP